MKRKTFGSNLACVKQSTDFYLVTLQEILALMRLKTKFEADVFN